MKKNKKSDEDFDDFIAAPVENQSEIKKEEISKNEPSLKANNEIAVNLPIEKEKRAQLLDEAFGDLEIKPPVKAAEPIKTEEIKKETVKNLPDILLAQPEKINSEPIISDNIPIISEKSQMNTILLPENIPENTKKEAQNIEDDDFGDFQESTPIPENIAPQHSNTQQDEKAKIPIIEENHKKIEENIIKNEEITKKNEPEPLIYRLEDSEINNNKKLEIKEEIIENIIIKENNDEPIKEKPIKNTELFEAFQEIEKNNTENKPKENLEKISENQEKPKETQNMETKTEEIKPEPIKIEEMTKSEIPYEKKIESNWASLIDLDFIQGNNESNTKNPQNLESAQISEIKLPEQKISETEKTQAEPTKIIEPDTKEINEHDLLSDFMAEYGKKPQKIEEPIQKSAKSEPVKKEKNLDDTKNLFYNPECKKPEITSETKDINTNLEILNKMAAWLWSIEDLENYEKLQEHIKAAAEINDLLAKKKKATENEEFELAIEYRNKINAAKSKIMNDSQILQFLTVKRKETMSEIIDKIIAIGDLQLYEFFKNEYLEKYQNAYKSYNIGELLNLKQNCLQNSMYFLFKKTNKKDCNNGNT